MSYETAVPCTCLICGGAVKNIREVLLHIDQHRYVEHKDCLTCVSGLASKEALSQHLTVHKVTFCVICWLTLDTPANLEFHMRQHAKERRFTLSWKTGKPFHQCQYCTYGFEDVLGLEHHLCVVKALWQPEPHGIQHEEETTTTTMENIKRERAEETENAGREENGQTYTVRRGRSRTSARRGRSGVYDSDRGERSEETDTASEDPHQVDNATMSSDGEGNREGVESGFSSLRELLGHTTGSTEPAGWEPGNIVIENVWSTNPNVVPDVKTGSVKPAGSGKFTCNVCMKSFNRNKNLTKHMSRHFAQSCQICSVCHKNFQSKERLRLHMKIHDAVRVVYDCKYCKKSFLNSYTRNVHERVHTGFKNLRCQVCNQVFVTNCDYNQHMASHLGLKPWACPICKKSFTRRGLLHGHLTIHVKSVKCEICERYFSSKSSLRYHQATHKGQESYSCRYCSLLFDTTNLRNLHEAESHNKVPQAETGTCPVCEGVFEQVNLLEHLKSHVIEVPPEALPKIENPLLKPFSCTKCPLRFANQATLKTHMKSHRKRLKNKFDCSMCEARFYSEGALKVHEAMHQGNGAIHCIYCKRTFDNEGDHVNYFHAYIETETSCTICHRTYSDKKCLRRHMKLHDTVAVAVQCRYCSKSFSTDYQRKRHERYNCSRARSQPFSLPHIKREPRWDRYNGTTEPLKEMDQMVNSMVSSERGHRLEQRQQQQQTSSYPPITYTLNEVITHKLQELFDEESAQEKQQKLDPGGVPAQKVPGYLSCDVCHQKFGDGHMLNKHMLNCFPAHVVPTSSRDTNGQYIGNNQSNIMQPPLPHASTNGPGFLLGAPEKERVSLQQVNLGRVKVENKSPPPQDAIIAPVESAAEIETFPCRYCPTVLTSVFIRQIHEKSHSMTLPDNDFHQTCFSNESIKELVAEGTNARKPTSAVSVSQDITYSSIIVPKVEKEPKDSSIIVPKVEKDPVCENSVESLFQKNSQTNIANNVFSNIRDSHLVSHSDGRSSVNTLTSEDSPVVILSDEEEVIEIISDDDDDNKGDDQGPTSLPANSSLSQGQQHQAASSHLEVTEPTSDMYSYVCPLCQEMFLTVAELQTHIDSHNSFVRRPNCTPSRSSSGPSPVMDDSTDNPEDLLPQYTPPDNNKVVKRAGKSQFSCPHCSFRGRTKGKLDRHLRIHNANRVRFPCSICPKSFTDAYYRRIHEELHAKKKYLCRICWKSYLREEQLQSHSCKGPPEPTKTVTVPVTGGQQGDVCLLSEGNVFRCLQCGKNFLDQSELVCHMSVHGGESPGQGDPGPMNHNNSHLQLDVTPESRASSSFNESLTNDTNHSHVDVPSPASTSSYSSSFTSSTSSKVRHSGGGENSLGSLTCDHCGRRFEHKAAYREHLKTHRKKKNRGRQRKLLLEPGDISLDLGSYSCMVCAESCDSAESLRAHHATHEEDGLFPCNHCDNVYTSLDKFQAHVLSVHK